MTALPLCAGLLCADAARRPPCAATAAARTVDTRPTHASIVAMVADPLTEKRDLRLMRDAIGIHEVVTRARFHERVERHDKTFGRDIFCHQRWIAYRHAEALHRGVRGHIERLEARPEI